MVQDLKGGLDASPLKGGRLKHSLAGITTILPMILNGYLGSLLVSPQGTEYMAWWSSLRKTRFPAGLSNSMPSRAWITGFASLEPAASTAFLNAYSDE